jgi:hypothetical protein
MRLVFLLALLISACGCNAGRAFIATPSDYADYRRVRIADSIEGRMAATWDYLEQRPDGEYHKRLSRYFAKAEPVFYKVKRRSMKGLEAYLRSLPHGPHAEDALEELMNMRMESRRGELLLRQARVAGIRLDFDRKKRHDAATLLTWWIGSLLNEALWDAPLSRAPKEFVVRYRLSLPRPECEPHDDDPDYRRCFKSVERGFRVAGGGKMVERTLAFDVELELDDRWRLTAATISGSGVFVSTVEAQLEETFDDAGEAARNFAAELGGVLAEKGTACNGGTNETGATILECESLRLTIEPGQGGGDDVIFIQRTSSDDEGDDDDDDDDDEGDDDEGDDDDDEGDDDDDDDEGDDDGEGDGDDEHDYE